MRTGAEIDDPYRREVGVGDHLVEGHVLPPPASQLAHRTVDGDGHRPREEPAPPLELRKPLEDADQRVLDDVLQEPVVGARPLGQRPPQAAEQAARKSDRAAC